jgi:hypothetical protein
MLYPLALRSRSHSRRESNSTLPKEDDCSFCLVEGGSDFFGALGGAERWLWFFWDLRHATSEELTHVARIATKAEPCMHLLEAGEG